MKKIRITKRLINLLLLTVLLGNTIVSCSDLEIEGTDSIIKDADETGFQGVSDPESFLDNAYNSLRGYIGDQANLYALSEVTTDEQLVPTRGSDWGDNGIWRQLHQHSWTAEHNFILNVWNQWNTLHFQGAQVLSELTNSTPEQQANAYFLRALGMWVILDNFGQVPVRDPQAPLFEDPVVLKGQEAVDQIVSDLNAAIAGLPAIGPGTGMGDSGAANARPGKEAAKYLLAKILLNKHIYLGTEPNSTDMNQVVSLVDEITTAGYGLEEGYFDIFRRDLDRETIWFIPTAVGNRIWNGLHYNQAPDQTGGGWNGFSTLAEFYDMFEGNPNMNRGTAEGVLLDDQEERRGYVPPSGLPAGSFEGSTDNNDDGFADGSSVGFGFLIDQQYDYDGTALNDRGGNPLTFKREFTNGSGEKSLINNSETTGIRTIKYNPRYGAFTEHEIFFRYSDAYLMKAEAIMRSGGDPTAMVNELRVLRKAQPLSSVTESDFLEERGRELYMEFWRRNDMIRFGEYTRDWSLKAPSAVGDETKNLFPIPANQLILNPNLTQNPGY
ncbi:RagB/SusD family nutrient uptake outer membrane protein [Salegentibacter sp. JZCK2]|uniref:RagB/SusD family nutrient uptake outer membrane protein n=1 Tax=Salegentibacter tibetensis TaxID=2873600 RepID=UPI001CCD333A|nr:RagB/SusD family nutrient uptake outer membrane protein [Salegentibacter tibetensis]MBZ9729336.1 RagB/SusD family nutrient uptake outer membrane protein [Salegentibacter tibetensis]